MIRTAWARHLFLVTGLVHLVFHASRLLLSYRVLDLGGGADDIGLTIAAGSLAPLLVVFSAGRAVDRWHPAWVLGGGIGALGAGLAVLAASDRIAWLLVGSMVLGLGHLLAMLSSQSFVPRFAGDEDLDRGFAGLTLAASVGQSLGLPLVGLFDQLTPDSLDPTRVGLVVVAVLSLIAVPSAVQLFRGRGQEPARPGGSDPEQHHSPTPMHALLTRRGMPAAMLSSLAVLASLDLLTGYLPLLGEERGWSASTVSLLLTVRAIASLVSRWLLGRLLAVTARNVLLLSATGFSAAAMAVVPLVDALPVQFAAMAVTGFFWGIGQPLTMSWVVMLAPQRDRGAALSLRLAGNRLGQVLVPLAVGAVSAQAGVAAVFWCTGAMLAGATAVAHRSLTTD